MHMIKYISFNIYVFIFTKQICDTLKLLVPTDALLILTFIHPQLSHHPCESDNVDCIYVPPLSFPTFRLQSCLYPDSFTAGD